MRIIRDQVREAYQLHHGIKCWTCKAMVSKSVLNRHKGHDVTYLKENGDRDD